MTLVFVTNFINHHQVPLADEFYKLLGKDYTFLATEAVPESFLKSGYPDYSNRPYLFKYYQDAESQERGKAIIMEADVVIFGCAPFRLLYPRLLANKFVYRYYERPLKNPWRYLSVGGWVKMLLTNSLWRHRSMYLLSAGAFVASDFRVYGAFKKKSYKWGYFTEVPQLDINEVLKKRSNKKIKIMWCARFISLKHPEMIPQLALYLKKRGYDFEINMVGDGHLRDKIEQQIENLQVQSEVNLLGNLPNSEVQELMREHHIFLFTSNQLEGWGAVLNESMSNGCAVVAAHKIGAVPFLIRDGINGLIFQSGNCQSLFEQVERLILHQEEREVISREAYFTMRDVWSPCNAACQFINLSRHLLYHEEYNIPDNGPCSRDY